MQLVETLLANGCKALIGTSGVPKDGQVVITGRDERSLPADLEADHLLIRVFHNGMESNEVTFHNIVGRAGLENWLANNSIALSVADTDMRSLLSFVAAEMLQMAKSVEQSASGLWDIDIFSDDKPAEPVKEIFLNDPSPENLVGEILGMRTVISATNIPAYHLGQVSSSEKCALAFQSEQIRKINELGSKATYRDFRRLVAREDKYSNLRIRSLRKLVAPTVIERLEKAPFFKRYPNRVVKGLHWILRGLNVDAVIRKAEVDEIARRLSNVDAREQFREARRAVGLNAALMHSSGRSQIGLFIKRSSVISKLHSLGSATSYWQFRRIPHVKDGFTSLGKEDLIKLLPTEVVRALLMGVADERQQVNAMKWFLRGMSLVQAMHKAKVDAIQAEESRSIKRELTKPVVAPDPEPTQQPHFLGTTRPVAALLRKVS